MCYICTLLLLMWSSPHLCRWFGSMPETLTLHQAASCNGVLYLSHKSSSITETASFLGVAAKYRNLLMVRYDKIHCIIVTFKKLSPHLTDGVIKCRVSVYLVMFQTIKFWGQGLKDFSIDFKMYFFKGWSWHCRRWGPDICNFSPSSYKSTPSDCSSTSLYHLCKWYTYTYSCVYPSMLFQLWKRDRRIWFVIKYIYDCPYVFL